MNLEQSFQEFIHRHRKDEKPVLLALSGGPDSLALFYLLKKYRIPFAVAHVDHGWRPESSEEAAILENLAKENGLPFHTKKLTGIVSELICREERIKFFIEIYQTSDYSAVVLGHHRDDQAETVLKRVLEGAALPHLGGMGESDLLFGVPAWRPLFHVPKKDIILWLERQNLKPFIDSTNDDPAFLRNRMRKTILPDLSASFGKEIQNSLFNLGEEVKEMHAFLQKHTASIIETIQRDTEGFRLDLSPHPTLTPFEIKHIIRSFCKKAGFTPSRVLVSSACQFVLKGTVHKVLIQGKYKLYVDCRHLHISIDNELFMCYYNNQERASLENMS